MPLLLGKDMVLNMLINDLEKLIENTSKELLTPENLKYLADEEFSSYIKEDYSPLTSNNLIIQIAIEKLREHFQQEFLKIQQQIEEGKQEAYKQLNLTEEEKLLADNYLKQHLKINTGIQGKNSNTNNIMHKNTTISPI